MKLTRGQTQLAILAALGGLLSWAIANHDLLLPYRWQSFRSADAGVSLEFPGKINVENRQATIPGSGTTSLHMVGARTPDGSNYAFGYADARISGHDRTEASLDSARDGSARNVQGVVIAEKSITVDKYSGRDVEVRARDHHFLDMRLILVNDRIYMLLVASPSEQDRDRRNIQKFFNSFKIESQ